MKIQISLYFAHCISFVCLQEWGKWNAEALSKREVIKNLIIKNSYNLNPWLYYSRCNLGNYNKRDWKMTRKWIVEHHKNISRQIYKRKKMLIVLTRRVNLKIEYKSKLWYKLVLSSRKWKKIVPNRIFYMLKKQIKQHEWKIQNEPSISY